MKRIIRKIGEKYKKGLKFEKADAPSILLIIYIIIFFIFQLLRG